MSSRTVRVIVYPDEGLIEKHFADGAIRKSSGSLHSRGTRSSYRHTSVDGRLVFIHRLIWEHVHGTIPDDMQIDHINGVRDDNRIENLRLVTCSQNNQNRHHAQPANKSGVKGVCWDVQKRKWTAQITHKKTKFYLGSFPTIEEARATYVGAAALIHTHNPHAAP